MRIGILDYMTIIHPKYATFNSVFVQTYANCLAMQSLQKSETHEIRIRFQKKLA